jgi:hypothetical protein
MSGAPQTDDTPRVEPPLWSIGLAVLFILVVPVLLYSLAPTGPLREGDTVFADGQQRVQLSESAHPPSLQKHETCLLDPGNPLIIVQRPTDRPDRTILAQVQSNQAVEWPFCPAHAEVLLRSHQIFQKPDVLAGMKVRLAGLIGR